MPLRIAILGFVFFVIALPSRAQELKKPENSVRIATYNVALNRKAKGALSKELADGKSKQAIQVAEVIQRVRPDVLLINELDYDGGKSVELFSQKYLMVGQGDLKPMSYKFSHCGMVNTGVPSGLDYDGNGKTGEPNDALGFGYFPGQYGMAIYSSLPIVSDEARSFQKFLWKDMPNRSIPVKKDGEDYYSKEVMNQFRLSSKSHWDVPIKVGDEVVHFLVCHPTPPVFDGAEDKNGCRNYDEIRMWVDYVSGNGAYLYDDSGKKGGFPKNASFVIAGDLNADPLDGDSRKGAMEQLLSLSEVNNAIAPESTGGKYWSDSQGGANGKHKGNPLCDTGDFSDSRVGNMRIDYVVPSKNLKIMGSGVFWPKPDEAGAEAAKASDHRLVWIDIAK
ncbi:MAG: endonuclease/exonuclease/phosphatase family protein [Planctomycetota bacterium]